jgi:hypothetical protein
MPEEIGKKGNDNENNFETVRKRGKRLKRTQPYKNMEN